MSRRASACETTVKLGSLVTTKMACASIQWPRSPVSTLQNHLMAALGCCKPSLRESWGIPCLRGGYLVQEPGLLAASLDNLEGKSSCPLRYRPIYDAKRSVPYPWNSRKSSVLYVQFRKARNTKIQESTDAFYKRSNWSFGLPKRILYRKLSIFSRKLPSHTTLFELECSISAQVQSSIRWNGTYPTLKTLLRFLF